MMIIWELYSFVDVMLWLLSDSETMMITMKQEQVFNKSSSYCSMNDDNDDLNNDPRHIFMRDHQYLDNNSYLLSNIKKLC